ncbi:MAG: 3(2),5-bisphosphate nucleotidase [Hyphomicrobiales bacterium]|nr:3(2),5-bisphosphate nucleotidase [Hyphomicrobiales bacterium]
METPGSDSDLQDLALVFARAAVAAGRLIMDVYHRDFAMRAKADASPVCEADEGSEYLIIERLQEACPAIPVVAEESFSRGVVPQVGGDFILVDPLDGTREFASRNGEFTVNVALIRDGAPVCGVVYAPAFGRLWVAAGAAHACDVAPGGEVPPLGGMRVIKVRPLDGRAPVAAISRSHLNDQTRALMERLGARDSRAAGSALKFCQVAEGRADVYPRIGPTMEWDIAAGDAVLRAAGGVVTGLDGAPLRYGHTDRGFASPDFVAFGDQSLIARL